MKGKLITLEGTEGSGKSLQARLLCKYLKNLGYKVIHTREPGNTNIGKSIRNLLLNPKNKSLTDITELFLYLADRSQHVEEVVHRNLVKGYIVVCDRFMDATVAYQGYGRRLPISLINKLNQLAIKGKKPDLTIILNVPLRLGLKRAMKVGPYAGDRIERQTLTFHRRVRNGYHKIAKSDPNRVKLIKAHGDISEIQKKIRTLVNKTLKHKQ